MKDIRVHMTVDVLAVGASPRAETCSDDVCPFVAWITGTTHGVDVGVGPPDHPGWCFGRIEASSRSRRHISLFVFVSVIFIWLSFHMHARKIMYSEYSEYNL